MLGWLFGRGYYDLGKTLAETRAQRDALKDKARDQMARADRAELNLSQAQHDLSVARNDIQALNQRITEYEKRIDRAAKLLYAEQDAHRKTRDRLQAEDTRLRVAVIEHADAANYYGGLAEDRRVENAKLWDEWDAAEAELARLATLIGNARNQLDGRKAFATEPACVGA
jgi:chromosome segregation ATPase